MKADLVLNNIFDSAVTYTKAGGQVTIALYQKNGQASLHVANKGSLIAEADVDNVFDRFWRGDVARTADTNERRYGLGLPLCRKLIMLLGGSISASTGSDGTFAISLSFPSQPAE